MNSALRILALLVMMTGQGWAATRSFSTGTGFVVQRGGYILTSRHVISRCADYHVYTRAASYPATLLASDAEHDLALLQSRYLPPYVADFAPLSEVPDGAVLWIAGYPEGTEDRKRALTRMAKLIKAVGPRDEPHLMQFMPPVVKGHSGGPVLDGYGRVAGVVMGQATIVRTHPTTRRVMTRQSIGLAISSDTALDFLQRSGLEVKHQEAGALLSETQQLDRLEAYTVNIRCAIKR